MPLGSIALAAALAWASPAGQPPAELPPSAPTQGAPTAPAGSAEKLEALVERYQEAQQAWLAELRAAEDDEQRERLYAEEPSKDFVDPFRELAYEAAGSETAAGAWIWVSRLAVQADRIEDAKEALQVLVRDHVESPQMAEVASELRYGAYRYGREVAEGTLRAIHSRTPHREAKAAAQFSLAAMLMEQGAESERAEAMELFVDLAASFADVEGGRWKGRAEGFLYELEHLAVGMVAPDFETVDQDGVAWKLSDYRGKVVILDFWGFW